MTVIVAITVPSTLTFILGAPRQSCAFARTTILDEAGKVKVLDAVALPSNVSADPAEAPVWVPTTPPAVGVQVIVSASTAESADAIPGATTSNVHTRTATTAAGKSFISAPPKIGGRKGKPHLVGT
ncbi:hypothetical protein ACHIPZ_01185 [Antrihabitans sp. NCIMB 15449]|uniref:Secreted protein n=1 Tax=Antrihabitans spumae TaxID=3373370 RepID=A0ABW7JGG8_9NOCA